MLAPPLSNTSLLLGNPDHIGTHAPLLLIFLVLDRAPRKWWTPVLIAIMLTWAQIADTLVLYEAAIPIALVGLLRANRRRGPLAQNWFDLSLTLGAAISAVAAKHILTLIRDSGGFIVKNPNVRFTTVKALPQGIFTDFARMLDVFGAKFLGMQVGSDATDTLLKLIGVVLVVWAVAAALRRLYRADADLIVQVLSHRLRHPAGRLRARHQERRERDRRPAAAGRGARGPGPHRADHPQQAGAGAGHRAGDLRRDAGQQRAPARPTWAGARSSGPV